MRRERRMGVGVVEETAEGNEKKSGCGCIGGRWGRKGRYREEREEAGGGGGKRKRTR